MADFRWMHDWVPHVAAQCPAFRACVDALVGNVAPAPGHHSIYSFALVWQVRP